ncbi:MAG TPA: GNAT family N-acetyltransferase [Bacteroidia bacterium]|nr:GNAT family N-acetyltransferase [Bacteroidia bacterium]
MKITKQIAEYYTWGNTCDGWHILKSDSLNVIEEKMPPHTSELLHCHRKAQQVFYILSGIASFQIKGEFHTLTENESIHILPQALHRIFNEGKEDLSFLLISQPMAQNDRIDIVPYSEERKSHIKILNEEWLTKYFSVEPNDVVQLSNPTEEIINKGGIIYYAAYNKKIVGTACLLKIDEHTYELGKMAVTDSAQGLGIGNVLMDYSIQLAKQLGAKSLILFSNTSLGSAIHLYEKYGFKKIDFEKGHYTRSNIKMEKVL